MRNTGWSEAKANNKYKTIKWSYLKLTECHQKTINDSNGVPIPNNHHHYVFLYSPIPFISFSHWLQLLTQSHCLEFELANRIVVLQIDHSTTNLRIFSIRNTLVFICLLYLLTTQLVDLMAMANLFLSNKQNNNKTTTKRWRNKLFSCGRSIKKKTFNFSLEFILIHSERKREAKYIHEILI